MGYCLQKVPSSIISESDVPYHRIVRLWVWLWLSVSLSLWLSWLSLWVWLWVWVWLTVTPGPTVTHSVSLTLKSKFNSAFSFHFQLQVSTSSHLRFKFSFKLTTSLWLSSWLRISSLVLTYSPSLSSASSTATNQLTRPGMFPDLIIHKLHSSAIHDHLWVWSIDYSIGRISMMMIQLSLVLFSSFYCRILDKVYIFTTRLHSWDLKNYRFRWEWDWVEADVQNGLGKGQRSGCE